MRIACLGPDFSFSDEAVRSRYPEAERCLTKGRVWEVLPEAEAAGCTHAVVPFHNNSTKPTDPPFPRIFDSLAQSTFYILEAFKRPISWSAMSVRPLAEAKVVYTHQTGPKQCGRFLEELRQRGCTIVADAASTADAAQKALADSGSLALGSQALANANGFSFVQHGIQDDPHNATWFFLVGKSIHEQHSESCITVVAMAAQGPELHEILSEFQIEVRNTGRFLDVNLQVTEFRMSSADPRTERLLELLRAGRGWSKILGCCADFDRTGIATD